MVKETLVRRVAMVGVLIGAPLFVSGCAMSPQTGQIIQAVVGLLGAAMSGAQGPLTGPLSGALPQGPLAAAPAGAAPAPQAPGTTAAPGAGGPMAQAIRQAAYNLPDPFPYKPGTQNGNLGCADVVSHALIEAGAMQQSEHDLAVAGVDRKLTAKGWREVPEGQYQDGDVIIWGKLPGGNHKHIGIIVIENGQTYAINNSSGQKRPIKSLLSSYNRSIEKVLRNPGGSAA